MIVRPIKALDRCSQYNC